MNLQNYTNVNIFKETYEHLNSNPLSSLAKPIASAAIEQKSQGFNPYVNNFGTTVGTFLHLLTKF